MKFVVGSLTERWVVQRDVGFVYNRCFAVIAPDREFLTSRLGSALAIGSKETEKGSHLVVVKMTERFPVVFIESDMFQRSMAMVAGETIRMPASLHSRDNASANRSVTPCARHVVR